MNPRVPIEEYATSEDVHDAEDGQVRQERLHPFGEQGDGYPDQAVGAELRQDA